MGLHQFGANMPIITVAMPVFNGARFLDEAIASILAQTCDDFELIISDDGSTDRSLEIAQGYAAGDARIVLVAGQHGGIASAMNRALAVARGKYFAPMDQDDIALPDRLGKLALFLEENPEIALVGGRVRLINEAGRIGREKVRPVRPRAVASAMLTSMAVIHPASMLRTEAACVVGGYRSILPFAEDYDLWLRLMERYQIANIADVVLLKRIHPGAVTQDRPQRAAQVVARTIAYLSHRSRATYGDDFVFSGQPLLVSAARFIDAYLHHCDGLDSPDRYHLSAFARYAPLLTTEPRAVTRPYLRYLAKTLRGSGIRQLSRTCFYLALHFGYHRWHQGVLARAFAAGKASPVAA